MPALGTINSTTDIPLTSGNTFSDFLPAGEAGLTAVYTDDTNVFWHRITNGDIRVCYGGMTTEQGKYVGGVWQDVTKATIWASATLIKGLIVQGGFYYICLSDGATPRVYRCPTTSSIATAGNWTQLTISGTAVGTGFTLIGYGNGNFWFATGSAFQPYTISGTTLTSGSTVTVTGSSYGISSRVNSNGIYAAFSSGPLIQFADFSGTLSGAQMQAASGATATFFCTSTSFYSGTNDVATNFNGYSKCYGF